MLNGLPLPELLGFLRNPQPSSTENLHSQLTAVRWKAIFVVGETNIVSCN